VTISVFGQGFVGLPLSVAFAKAGFKTFGVDVNLELIRALGSGKCPGKESLQTELNDVLARRTYEPTTEGFRAALQSNLRVIAVQTPIDRQGRPDLGPLKSVSSLIAKSPVRSQITVVESSTFPGTIDETVIPILESGGLISGKDFGVAYCPERVNPGDRVWTLENIPRIIAATDKHTLNFVRRIYESVVKAPLVEVSSIRTAETVKLFENTFRLANISLVNELAIFCERTGVDITEVIQAASTKPFGFSPFYPGPGAGGACIPKDPALLEYAARKTGVAMRVTRAALATNFHMSSHIVKLVDKAFRSLALAKNCGPIVVAGISFKEDVQETENSPGLIISELLVEKGYDVRICDPLVPEERLAATGFSLWRSLETVKLSDVACICVVQLHSQWRNQLQLIVDKGDVPIVVDCKNKLLPHNPRKTLLVRLGAPFPMGREI
jgi:nucleotide sugar dehydrogenase